MSRLLKVHGPDVQSKGRIGLLGQDLGSTEHGGYKSFFMENKREIFNTLAWKLKKKIHSAHHLAWFPIPTPLSLRWRSINPPRFIFYHARALDGLWREIRGAVNRLRTSRYEVPQVINKVVWCIFDDEVLHYKTFSREVYYESSLNTTSLFSWNKYNVILTEKCGSLPRNRF